MTNNDEQNKNPIKENLNQQFQELGSKIKLPEDLKEETFNTIDSFNLLGDFS